MHVDSMPTALQTRNARKCELSSFLFFPTGFIGFADSIYELLEKDSVADTDDDQLFYTKLFLNQKLRESLNIKLDYKAEIFQNLYGVNGR